MSQQFIHIRIDPKQKKSAEKILGSLGLTMTTAIHLFLNSVIEHRGIPFEIKQSRDSMLGSKIANLERKFQSAVKNEVENSFAGGNPVALYDKIKKRSFLEYPDGMRVYTDE